MTKYYRLLSLEIVMFKDYTYLEFIGIFRVLSVMFRNCICPEMIDVLTMLSLEIAVFRDYTCLEIIYIEIVTFINYICLERIDR